MIQNARNLKKCTSKSKYWRIANQRMFSHVNVMNTDKKNTFIFLTVKISGRLQYYFNVCPLTEFHEIISRTYFRCFFMIVHVYHCVQIFLHATDVGIKVYSKCVLQILVAFVSTIRIPIFKTLSVPIHFTLNLGVFTAYVFHFIIFH